MESQTQPAGPPPGSDRTGLAILLGNAVTIILAMWQGWHLHTILAVYWFQSVVIGYFNYRRMLMLQNFTTAGLSSNGDPVPETERGKRDTANFFLMHYGFFHLCYLVFLAGGDFDLGPLAILSALAGAVSFFFSHRYSFRRNVEQDLAGRPNLGTLLFLPYLRVVPMHLAIIIGGSVTSSRRALLFFLVLKSIADYLMHVVEHRMMQKKGSG